MHQGVCYLNEMSCGSDNDPGKRDANAAERVIAEVKSKVHGAGEGDGSDSSDGHAGSGFLLLPCTEICEISVEV